MNGRVIILTEDGEAGENDTEKGDSEDVIKHKLFPLLQFLHILKIK